MALRQVLRQVEAVAPTNSTVLIQGGDWKRKELIARAVHNLSQRRSRPFIKLNCAAIPAGLLESSDRTVYKAPLGIAFGPGHSRGEIHFDFRDDVSIALLYSDPRFDAT
jgi:hypothetical protein